MSVHRIVTSGTLCLLLAACGGTAIPAGKLSNSQASLRAAEEVGADRYPKSALHLKMARDQMKQADVLIRADEGEAAGRALDRARADAELAVTLARAEQAQERARAAQARVDQLRGRMVSTAQP